MAAPMEESFELIDVDDYYAWLGLSKNASKDEINNAFRRFSRIYHPDKHAADPGKAAEAQALFTRMKMAYEVLSDPQKRAIYDTMGVKGLETEGWELVTRTKTPQEILEEFERLEREREERRLEQRTNPKGNITVGVDATDMFDSYSPYDSSEYRPLFPHIEINQMSISQSVDCPLTSKDTCVLSGNLNTQNGNGGGSISGSWRRLTANNGWVETEVTGGSGAGVTVRCFRTLWRRTYGTLAGSLQVTPRGFRPAANAMLATQLDKNLQARITCGRSGRNSNVNTSIIYDTERNHVMFTIQLGIPSTFASLSYARKFPDQDMKLKGALKAGPFGVMLEYGVDKKITKFSTLGASMHLGPYWGVTLKVKLVRGSQTYVFPLHLADELVPQAVFYGTITPVAVYFVVKLLIVKPFLTAEKEKDIARKKEANLERMAEKKKSAELAVDLMQETVRRSVEAETAKSGLIIRKALFGKLSDEARESEHISVSVPLQALVKDSRLYLAENTSFEELPGFYDPCIGEDKELHITYEFRRRLHMATFQAKAKVLLPHRDHLCDTSQSSTPSTSATEYL